MKNFHVFCYLSIIILSYLTSVVDSIFPVDLIRIVLLFPSTPVLATPAISWGIFLMSYGVLALSIYIGLPRNPTPKPVKRKNYKDRRKIIKGRPKVVKSRDIEDTDEPELGLNYGAMIDTMAQLDTNDCLARYLCHIGTQKPDDSTFMQKIMFNLIMMTASPSPPFSYTLYSPRRTLLDAVRFGQTGQCSACCTNLYQACNLTDSQLLLF